MCFLKFDVIVPVPFIVLLQSLRLADRLLFSNISASKHCFMIGVESAIMTERRKRALLHCS